VGNHFAGSRYTRSRFPAWSCSCSRFPHPYPGAPTIVYTVPNAHRFTRILTGQPKKSVNKNRKKCQALHVNARTRSREKRCISMQK
jgi:hypothetical protein